MVRKVLVFCLIGQETETQKGRAVSEGRREGAAEVAKQEKAMR